MRSLSCRRGRVAAGAFRAGTRRKMPIWSASPPRSPGRRPAPTRRRSRRCASISTGSTPRAASTARRSISSSRTIGRAVEGRRQRQEAGDARTMSCCCSTPACRRPTRRSIAEAKRAGVPLLFASAVCPKESIRRPRTLQFCTTGVRFDLSTAAPRLAFVKETAKEPVKIGFAAMADSDLARRDRFRREDRRQTLGMDSGRQGGHSAADRRLHAVRQQDQGCRRELGVLLGAVGDRRCAPSRRCGGSAGRATTSPGRISRPRTSSSASRIAELYVVGANALFEDALPIHKEIAEAAKRPAASIRPDQMTEGWIAGMVIEAALTRPAGPRNAGKVQAAMENLKVDTQGPARRSDRVDQGQPLPHQAVLSRLPLGRLEGRRW